MGVAQPGKSRPLPHAKVCQECGAKFFGNSQKCPECEALPQVINNRQNSDDSPKPVKILFYWTPILLKVGVAIAVSIYLVLLLGIGEITVAFIIAIIVIGMFFLLLYRKYMESPRKIRKQSPL